MTENVVKEMAVWRVNGDQVKTTTDSLINETPISLVYNGISHVVLMATAQDLSELALGFSLTEGILTHPGQLYDVEVEEACNGILVQMEIASEQFQALKGRRRNMTGRTGCGLCGIENLDAVKPDIKRIDTRYPIPLAHINQALSVFADHQPLRENTGSVHGVAWVNNNGEIVALFEDAGRHNALDKLIGYGAKAGWDWSSGFVLVSSRASYEMVVKSAVMGIGCLVAVSAPTALAVSLAQEANMTLIGFAKPERQVIYAGHEYITVKNEA